MTQVEIQIVSQLTSCPALDREYEVAFTLTTEKRYNFLKHIKSIISIFQGSTGGHPFAHYLQIDLINNTRVVALRDSMQLTAFSDTISVSPLPAASMLKVNLVCTNSSKKNLGAVLQLDVSISQLRRVKAEYKYSNITQCEKILTLYKPEK